MAALGRPGRNTSKALECGFVETEWFIGDFPESEVRQWQRTVVPDVQMGPLQGPLSVPAESVLAILFQH